MHDDISDTESPQTCNCSKPATFRWHDGMWTTGAFCFDCIRETLPKENRLETYRDALTTKDNMTTIDDGRIRIVPAGARPINGPWATIRTKEAIDEWCDEHPEVQR